MLTIGTAQELRDAGLEWTPATLDFFFIPLPDLENQIFVISDMTILSEQLQGQPALTFHGTVEWALDHVWTGEALWVPREDQLRQLIETRLATTSDWRLALESSAAGYRCQLQHGSEAETFEGHDVSECLADALLHLMRIAPQLARQTSAVADPP